MNNIKVLYLIVTCALLSVTTANAIDLAPSITKVAIRLSPAGNVYDVAVLAQKGIDYVMENNPKANNAVGGTIYNIKIDANKKYLVLGGTMYEIKQNASGAYETVGGSMYEGKKNIDKANDVLGGTLYFSKKRIDEFSQYLGRSWYDILN